MFCHNQPKIDCGHWAAQAGETPLCKPVHYSERHCTVHFTLIENNIIRDQSLSTGNPQIVTPSTNRKCRFTILKRYIYMSSSLNALSVSAVSCCLPLVVTPLASGAHNKVVTTLWVRCRNNYQTNKKMKKQSAFSELLL